MQRSETDDNHAHITKQAMKLAYQHSGCCPLLSSNYNKCNIVHVEGGPQSGFTCSQVEELYCAATGDDIEYSPCELCYGIHSHGECANTPSPSPTPSPTPSPSPSPPALPASVVNIIVESASHTVLEAAVTKANLVTALQAAGTFTVFAPTDSAFAAALQTLELTQAQLLDLDTLPDILKHHVLTSKVLSSQIAAGESTVTTLAGTTLTVTKSSSGVFIGGAQVTAADLEAENGVVHVINQVLLPPSPSPSPLFVSELSGMRKVAPGVYTITFPNGDSNDFTFTELQTSFVGGDGNTYSLPYQESGSSCAGTYTWGNQCNPVYTISFTSSACTSSTEYVASCGTFGNDALVSMVLKAERRRRAQSTPQPTKKMSSEFISKMSKAFKAKLIK